MKKKYLSKILVLCLMLSLVVSLAACGKKDAPANDPVSSGVEKPVEEKPTKETESETIVPEEILGQRTETSYVNEHFGLHYDTPDDWYLLSRQEIATVIGITAASFDDEAMAAMLSDSGYVMDFYVMDTNPAIDGTDMFNTASITIQDIGRLYGILYDEKKIAEGNATTIEDSLKALGGTDVNVEISEAEFIGKKSVVSINTSKIDDINMYQKQVYLKSKSALACVTATSFGEDRTDEILSVFY